MAATVVSASDRFKREDRKLRIAMGDTVGSNKVRNKTVTWADIVSRLREPVRTKESYKDYMSASRERQDSIKDVGYYVPTHFEGGIRKKANMSTREMVTLDIDFAPVDFLDAIDIAFGGYTYALHSTHKHSSDKPRLRLIFPLSRPVNEDEYSAVSRKLADLVDIDWFDDTTFEFARVMHWPSASHDGEYVFYESKGRWVDPDEVLGWYDNWQDIAQWPTSSRVQGGLHKPAEKAEDPRNKKGIVGAFCRIYDVPAAIETFLSDVYLPTDDGTGRYTYAKGTTSNGAVVYDDGLFLYSHHGTDPCSGRLVNAFDLVRLHLFGSLDAEAKEDTSPSKLPSFKAMAELAREDTAVRRELLADVADRLAAVAEELADDGEEPGEVDAGRAADEIDDLIASAGALKKRAPKKAVSGDLKEAIKAIQNDAILDANDRIKINLRNIKLILEKDPILAGAVAFNEFQQDLVQLKTLPKWPVIDEVNGDLWTDHCDLLVKYHLETVYDLEVPTTVIREALDLVGYERRWHPVRSYLESLTWDGKKRVETLFIRYLGAQDTPYTRQVARKFLTAAVARIFKPGVKFDHAVILEGQQGAGKSTFIRLLSKGWFTDDLKSFDNKAAEVLKGKWFVEVSELQGFTQSEIEVIKAFFSRQTDRHREAYARRAMDFPRQCVFMGSTNQSRYFRDETGNRRFWPIQVTVPHIDLPRFASEIDQLWAEAVQLYRAGEDLHLDHETEQLAKVEQAKREVDDELVGMIESWLDEPIRADHYDRDDNTDLDFNSEGDRMVRRERVCALEVWVELMGGRIDNFDQAKARRVNRALRKVKGWTESDSSIRFGKKYGKQRGFVRIELADDFGL